jgi:hypothetical protein
MERARTVYAHRRGRRRRRRSDARETDRSKEAKAEEALRATTRERRSHSSGKTLVNRSVDR